MTHWHLVQVVNHGLILTLHVFELGDKLGVLGAGGSYHLFRHILYS